MSKPIYVQYIKVYSTSKGDICEVKHEVDTVKGIVVEYGAVKETEIEKVPLHVVTELTQKTTY